MEQKETSAIAKDVLAAKNEEIAAKADAQFEKGNNHFQARGVMAWFAIYRRTPDGPARQAAIAESDEVIKAHLAERGAAVEIYEVHDENGVESQVSRAYVRVLARDGIPTNTPRVATHGEAFVRTQTPPLEQ